MAKSSRGRGQGRSTKRRVPLDWVVQPDTYGYNSTLNLPNASQSALALTLPKFLATTEDPTASQDFFGWQFPEQSKGQEAYAVRGTIIMVPSTWAIGSQFHILFRIVCKQVAYGPGPVSIEDPAYSLVQPQFANERFCWQRVVQQTQVTGNAQETISVNWTGKQRIKEDEALWLYAENQSGVTMTVQLRFYLRTLMRADE